MTRVTEAEADAALQRIHHDLGILQAVFATGLPLKVWKDVVLLQQRIEEQAERIERLRRAKDLQKHKRAIAQAATRDHHDAIEYWKAKAGPLELGQRIVWLGQERARLLSEFDGGFDQKGGNDVR